MRFRLIVVLVILVAAAAASAFWWKVSLAPVNSQDKTTVSFAVARGDGAREVARKLKDAKLIRDQVAFFLLERFLVKETLQAGSFKLSPSLSAVEIAKELTVGTEDIWITIPEGWRAGEIIAYLRGQNISAPVGQWDEEGRYFPETYLVPKTITIDGVRQLMRATFDNRVSSVSADNLILASLVEREAKTEEDRPKVASVLLNRLNLGMKLDVDATVQYALGYWKKDLTLEDLKIQSPYNTYLNAGLPPGPIANPGLSAIKAVLNPAKTDYLYYISDKSGAMHFAKTIDEHNNNIAKYLGS